MKRESSIFGHFWLFQGIIYLTIYIFLSSIFCFWTPFVTVEQKGDFSMVAFQGRVFRCPRKSTRKAVELGLFLKNHGGHVQLCRFTMWSFFSQGFSKAIEEISNTVSVSVSACNGFSSPLGMSRFVSSLALALLILLDGFAPSRMAWHGATDLKTTASSHRRLKDELLTDSMASVDPEHFPEIPNLLRAPSCPGDWQPALSLTYWLVAVLFACCVFIVSFVIAGWVAACLEKHGCCCCGDLLVE